MLENNSKCWICGRTIEEALKEFKERIINFESKTEDTGVPVKELMNNDNLLTLPILVDEKNYSIEHNYLEASYINLELLFKLAIKNGDRVFLDGSDTHVSAIAICPVCAVLLNMMKSKKE